MSIETTRANSPRSIPERVPTHLITMEDGTQKRFVRQPLAFQTVAEARAYHDQLPEGIAKAELNSRIYDAENKINGLVTENALAYGDTAMGNLNEIVETTDAQTAAVNDAIEKVKGGTMSATDAAKLMEKVIRSQQSMDKTVDAKRAGTARVVAHYSDPIKHHDNLVRNMPVLRKGRPVVTF